LESKRNQHRKDIKAWQGENKSYKHYQENDCVAEERIKFEKALHKTYQTLCCYRRNVRPEDDQDHS